MKQKKKWQRKLLFFVILLFSALWAAPLFVTVYNSFMVQAHFSFAQYKQLLIETPMYLIMFWNSMKLTVPIVIGSLAVATLGAYGFTILRFRGKEALFFIYIIVMLLPLQVTLMPNYMIAGFLHIRDSYWAIILPAVFNPFGVFLLRQQMKLLPLECVEAARIDGAGHAQIFLKMIVPMIKSGIAALAILLIVEYWNLFDQALIFIQDMDKFPMSIFLERINQEAEQVSYAAAAYYMIPVLVLVCYGYGFLKEGIGLMNQNGG